MSRPTLVVVGGRAATTEPRLNMANKPTEVKSCILDEGVLDECADLSTS